MVYKIGSSSSLLLVDKTAFLTVRRSWKPILLLALFILAGISLWFFDMIESEIEKTSIFFLFSIAVVACVFITIIYELMAIENSEINLINNSFVRKKKIFSIVFQKTTITWPEGYSFKYSIYFDTYNRIEEIWLIVYTHEKEDNRKLVRFFDKDTFLDFQKIFNQHFPENKIMEWHD
jgi:hypothetical protein